MASVSPEMSLRILSFHQDSVNCGLDLTRAAFGG